MIGCRSSGFEYGDSGIGGRVKESCDFNEYVPVSTSDRLVYVLYGELVFSLDEDVVGFGRPGADMVAKRGQCQSVVCIPNVVPLSLQPLDDNYRYRR